jgi:hypothetical protein
VHDASTLNPGWASVQTVQHTPTSSPCPQLWLPQPLKLHEASDASLPLQTTSSIHIGPLPPPKF